MAMLKMDGSCSHFLFNLLKCINVCLILKLELSLKMIITPTAQNTKPCLSYAKNALQYGKNICIFLYHSLHMLPKLTGNNSVKAQWIKTNMSSISTLHHLSESILRKFLFWY